MSLDNWYALSWFPTVVDSSTVTGLTLRLVKYLPPNSHGITCMDRFLQQMPNLSLFQLTYLSSHGRDSPGISDVCCALIQHLNPSTLKYLKIPVAHLAHVRIILERFTRLFKVNFQLTSSFITTTEIVNYFSALRSDSSLAIQQDSVSIWMGND